MNMNRRIIVRAPRLQNIAVLFVAMLALAGCGSSPDGQATTSSQISQPPVTAPALSGTPNTTAPAMVNYQFTPTAVAPPNKTLTFQISSNKPAWLTMSPTTGALSGMPPKTDIGNVYSGIVITASDGSQSASLAAFSIQVIAAPNQAPVISGTPKTAVQANTAYDWTPTASDPDGGGSALAFSVANAPAWAQFNANTGRLFGTPPAAGIFSRIAITVTDAGGLSATLPAFSIQVTAAGNNAPVLTGTPDGAVISGATYSFTPVASDPDANTTLTFSIANPPPGSSFSTANGTLTWNTLIAKPAVGAYAGIVISVSDGQATVSLPAFSIQVADTGGIGSATVSWTPPTQNTDGSALTDLAGYTIYYGTSSTQLTQTVDINSVGIVSYVVTNLRSGTYYFAVTARNGSGVESDLSNIANKAIP